jgi:hypothetical protein
MAPSTWWQAPDDADLDYGYDSDEIDNRPDSDRTTYSAHTDDTEKKQDEEQKGVIGNMSSWIQRQAGSSQGQLATTAVLSGAAVAGAIFGYQTYKRKEAVSDLKASIPNIDDSHPAGKVRYAGAARLVQSELWDEKPNSHL